MNLGASVTYNGLSLNTVTTQSGGLPMSGYAVEKFQPLPPPPTEYLEKRALTDGLDAGDVFLGGRTFMLIVTAYGTSAGDFWDKAQDLITGFTPTIAYTADSTNRGFLAFDFTQPTADTATWSAASFPDGIPMRYYVRPEASPTFLIERDKDGGSSTNPMAKTFDIRLLARDPRKYYQTLQSTSLSVAGSTSTITYRGDYPSPAILTFSLSATGHSAFTIVVDGISNVINLSSVSTGDFTLDYGRRYFYSSTDTSEMDLISSIGGWADVSVGSTVSLLNTTGIQSPLFKYRSAWA